MSKGDPAHPGGAVPLRQSPDSHHRRDRFRHERRQGAVPGRGHGRLHPQTREHEYPGRSHGQGGGIQQDVNTNFLGDGMKSLRLTDSAIPQVVRCGARQFLPLLLLCLFPLSALAEGERVLFISSYHPGFPTFFQQTEGLRTELEPAGITLDVEFMDTKRFSGTEYEALFLEHLRFKLKKVPCLRRFRRCR